MWRDEKCIQDFVEKSLRTGRMEELSADWRIILKWISQK
jgi:hypothetical protein